MMLSLIALAPLLLPQAQDPGTRRKPLIPPPPKTTEQEAEAKETPQPAPSPSQEGGSNPFSGTQQGNPFAAVQGQAAPPAIPWPRATKSATPPPFSHDRPLLRVDGIDITAQELNDLVAYYESFRPGLQDMLLIDAVAALLPSKVMQAHFAADLPGMKARIDQARQALSDGADFATVVADFSEDSEAPTDDARYRFGRERAVQPFDRLSFSTPEHQLSAPFLTVYGYHLLEVVGHEAKAMPAEDTVEVRHILVMYPGLKQLEEGGTDIRAWIKEQVKGATIEVLEPGMEHLLPPEYRQ